MPDLAVAVLCRDALLLTGTSFVFSAIAFAVTVLGMRNAASAVFRVVESIHTQVRRLSRASLGGSRVYPRGFTRSSQRSPSR